MLLRKTSFLLVLCLICTFLISCTKNPISLQDTDGVPSSASSSIGETYTLDSFANLPNITSKDIEQIKPNATYAEIFTQLGRGANFADSELMVYFVDASKLLVLRFKAATDRCSLSGRELLKTAIPFQVPKHISLEDNILYGVAIKDRFICGVSKIGLDGYDLKIAKADICFADGSTATKQDILFGDSLLVEYDVILESYPLQVVCKKITVLNRSNSNN